MYENDQSAVCADAWLAEHLGALGLQFGLGGVDVGHLEADMVLSAGRISGQKVMQRAVLAQGLDQLDLAVGRIDEADPYPLRRQVEGLVDRRRAEHVAIERDALLDRRGG